MGSEILMKQGCRMSETRTAKLPPHLVNDQLIQRLEQVFRESEHLTEMVRLSQMQLQVTISPVSRELDADLRIFQEAEFNALSSSSISRCEETNATERVFPNGDACCRCRKRSAGKVAACPNTIARTSEPTFRGPARIRRSSTQPSRPRLPQER